MSVKSSLFLQRTNYLIFVYVYGALVQTHTHTMLHLLLSNDSGSV